MILLIGFCLAVFYLSALYLSIAVMVGNPFTINPDYPSGKFAEGFGFAMRGTIHPEAIIPLLLLVLYHKGFPLLCFMFLYKLKPEPDPELKQNQ